MSRTFSISNGSGGSLKVSPRWGRKSEGAPDAFDGHAAQPDRASERARAPVRGARRGCLQGGDDHLFDQLIGDGSRRHRARLLQQPVEPVPHEARALPDRAGEYDARPSRQLRRGARSSGQRLHVRWFGPQSEQWQPLGVPFACSPPCRAKRHGRTTCSTFFRDRTLVHMLTPMMVQYLVGLCCLRRDPDAIDVTIGDMVMDGAAGKERDVDVTVTLVGDDGEITAFKASEVKHEGKALDVTVVEQLIMKLSDMPKITHKAIFSTSGYTDGARLKASSHGVELYTLKPWDRLISQDFPDFPGIGTPGEFLANFQTNLLYWAESYMYFVASGGPTSFAFTDETPVVSPDGRARSGYATMLDYKNDLLMRSTGILCTQDPALTVQKIFPYGMNEKSKGYLAGPAWPHTHTLDLASDGAHLQLNDLEPFRLDSVTISGHLQWRKRVIEPEFKILERVGDKSIFGGRRS